MGFPVNFPIIQFYDFGNPSTPYTNKKYVTVIKPKNVARDWKSTPLLETLGFFNEKHHLIIRKKKTWQQIWVLANGQRSYSYGHLLVITACKWDYAFYKWGLSSTYNIL